MAKDLGPKCKLCRRAGEKLFLKGDRCNTPKCAMIKRNYPPGFHGPRRRTRMTGYGIQLNEKQKAKRQYNMLEKQFRLTFDRARNQKGNLGENFIKLLELRLDNVVYRLGMAKSRNQARQLVGHGFINVNGAKVSIPSYTVKPGEEISIKSNKREAKIVKAMIEEMKQKDVPGWLNMNNKEIKGKVLHVPEMGLIHTNFNVQMIVEYYSK